MKMYIKSVMVDDQAKALAFYTDILGFQVKHDSPAGDYRWITLVSAEETNGVELGLEPNAHGPSRDYQAALKADGIPWTAFSVSNIDAEVARLKAAGVSFTTDPVDIGGAKIAIFDDTCGNLIQLMEVKD